LRVHTMCQSGSSSRECVPSVRGKCGPVPSTQYPVHSAQCAVHSAQ
jgi:hypothetical protein